MDKHEQLKTNYSLQVLRVIACLGVLGVHLAQNVSFPEPIGRFLSFGSQGPYFFFIISGYFMMTSRDLARNDWKQYLKKRAIRIIPLYYSVLGLYFATYLVGESFGIQGLQIESKAGLWTWNWLRYFCGVNLILPANEQIWENMGAMWSVSCFVIFYLMAPGLYKFASDWKRATLLFCIFMGISVGWESVTHLPGLWVSTLPYFMTGILIYRCKERHNLQSNLIFVCTTLLVGMLIYDVPIRFKAWCAFIVLIASADYLNSSKKQMRIISLLDKRSYSIYLMHPLAILWTKAYGIESKGIGNLENAVMILLLTVILVEVYQLIEKLFKKVFHKKRVEEST